MKTYEGFLKAGYASAFFAESQFHQDLHVQVSVPVSRVCF